MSTDLVLTLYFHLHFVSTLTNIIATLEHPYLMRDLDPLILSDGDHVQLHAKLRSDLLDRYSPVMPSPEQDHGISSRVAVK